MVHRRVLQVAFAALVYSLSTNAEVAQDGPTVQLDSATVLGVTKGTVESFLGIPFAEPPVGDLRLRLPKLLTAYNGQINGTVFGNQCLATNSPGIPDYVPQDLLADLVNYASSLDQSSDRPQSEDCLSINVIRPANTPADAKLPVLAWIYGGGFAQGSNSIVAYNGSAIVERSVAIGEPIIYVAINYRLAAFGFLGGKEIEEAGLGNLGLHDQRTALRWVNKFISAFGGDPKKVTIWGESAGSISVALQMLTNDGDTEGLFRAGIMSSGSIPPTGDLTDIQATYDFVVDHVGCSGSADVLGCLRNVSADSLLEAANQDPNSGVLRIFTSPYIPHADGVFIKEPIQKLALKGKLAKIPFIIGDVLDEATFISSVSTNYTTDDQFVDFVKGYVFPGASSLDIQPILTAYPSDPAAGSPFGTGSENAFTPQFKRISALHADWFFNGPRRTLLNKYSARQPAYYFLDSRNSFPGLGVPHGADLLNAFGPGDMTDYFIRFVRELDPNAEDGVRWPRYNTSARSSLEFKDGDEPLGLHADVERTDAINVASALSLRFPF